MPEPLRVLIAEDEPLVGEMIEGLLSEIGYVVAGRAADGHDAVEQVERLRPDVVLMDLEMQRCDGVAATRAIRARCPTPVVALSAHVTPDWLARANDAGVSAYLSKPATPDQLRRALVVAVARFRELERNVREVEQLKQSSGELDALRRNNRALEEALVASLSRGLLPICSSCKGVRDDDGYWRQVETHILGQSAGDFTYGLCPECVRRHVRRSGRPPR